MISVIAEGVVKSYGATRALAGLSMTLNSGEIVGIAGPNGAGKSTLTRMLAGEEQPDRGSIRLTHDDVSTDECWRHVAVVHQEPYVWPNMTVRENLAVGRETRWLGKIESPPQSDETLRRLDILQYGDYQLADLSLAVRQRVEIARALLCDADVFLFDEPNSALTDDESKALFATMRELASDGKIVLLITHRLNDFVRICGRVLILRDGLIACELIGEGVSENAIAVELSSHSVAESLNSAQSHTQRDGTSATTALTISNWSDPQGAFKDVSLSLAKGKIVVLAGVEGSGARELAQAIGGYRAVQSHVDGNETLLVPASVTYLAASRRDTVFFNMTVGENLVARRSWSELCGPIPLLRGSRVDKAAISGVERYRIKTGSPDHPITSLSGGNQQKVVLGAAMDQYSDILVVEEPTRGVDITSSNDIYRLLAQYAAAGKSVVLFCTEVQEMFQVAHEIVVMGHGTMLGAIDMGDVSNVVDLANMLAGYEAKGVDSAYSP